jgi:hypothetical protein
MSAPAEIEAAVESALSRVGPRTCGDRRGARSAAMTLEAFQSTKLQAKTRAVIEQANTIITEHRHLGFTLTLRQLFYQFVSRPSLGVANTLRD